MRTQYSSNPDFERIKASVQRTSRRMLAWNCDVFSSLPKGFWTVVAESIYQRIGYCPGDLPLYHIDHIIPLAAFGYGWRVPFIYDPSHKSSVNGYCTLTESEIFSLLHPENYRWLSKSENLSKNGNWNKQILINWLKAHPCLMSQIYNPNVDRFPRHNVFLDQKDGRLLLQVNSRVTGCWLGK